VGSEMCIRDSFFTTKERGRGTGLGLATVHGIIEQSGGFISIYSELGHGTRVSAMLPATEHKAAEVEVLPSPIEQGQSETILVVEDAADLREVTERILAGNGYHVITASDGPAAIEASLRYQGKIDLLLTDVVMPKMHGKDVADAIVTTRPGIRVLFMSGYAEPMLGKSGVWTRASCSLRSLSPGRPCWLKCAKHSPPPDPKRPRRCRFHARELTAKTKANLSDIRGRERMNSTNCRYSCLAVTCLR